MEASIKVKRIIEDFERLMEEAPRLSCFVFGETMHGQVYRRSP